MNDNQQKTTQPEIEHTESKPTKPDLVDDVVFEDNTEVTSIDSKKKYDALKAQIKELEIKAASYLDSWQRDKADFINLRKRDDEMKKQVVGLAKEEIIEGVIPVLDSFESAMKNKESWEKVETNWRVGIEYIANQLSQILETHGLKKIYPLGEAFDHTRDEAMEIVLVKEAEKDGIVLEVVQSGYMMGEKIIRPAKVKVGELSA